MAKAVGLLLFLFLCVSCGASNDEAKVRDLQMRWDGEKVIAMDNSFPKDTETGEYLGNFYNWVDEEWAIVEEGDPQFIASVQDCPDGFDCTFDLYSGLSEIPYHNAVVEMRSKARIGDTAIFSRVAENKPVLFEGARNEINDQTLQLLKDKSECFKQNGTEFSFGVAERADHRYEFRCGEDTVEIDFKELLSQEEVDKLTNSRGVLDTWVLQKGMEPVKVTERISNFQTTESQVFGIGENNELLNSADGIGWKPVVLPEAGSLAEYEVAIGGYIAVKVCGDADNEESCAVYTSADHGETWGDVVPTSGFLGSVGPSGVAIMQQTLDPDKDEYVTEVVLYDFAGEKRANEKFAGNHSRLKAIVNDEGMLIESQQEVTGAEKEWNFLYTQVNKK